jgi:hypothetical protein
VKLSRNLIDGNGKKKQEKFSFIFDVTHWRLEAAVCGIFLWDKEKFFVSWRRNILVHGRKHIVKYVEI